MAASRAETDLWRQYMLPRTIRVLLVEDNPEDVLLFRAMFRKEAAGSFEFTHLTRMQDAQAHLVTTGADIVLLDLGLPDGQGIDVVRRARSAAPEVPLIVVTGLDDESLVAQAMKEGAQDYLVKGQIENRALPRALRHAIERHAMLRERDAIRRQQLQLKDDFLSHVSHELRSPLTAIHQFSTIIADGLAGPTSPEQAEYLDIIVRNVKHLKSMIDDLLEVTRAGAGKLNVECQRMPVSDVIEYAVATLQGAAQAKGITLHVDLPEEALTVHADPTRVRQVLLILGDNAIKFTPPQGTITLKVASLASDPAFVVWEVRDTGRGIRPELHEAIFDRLYQAADDTQGPRKGLGLGLHIAKELVTRQGGRLWVMSREGEGAVFSFTTPVQPPGPYATLRPPRSTDTRTLLTVEMHPPAELSASKRAEWSCAARDQLRRFLRHELDLVLPDAVSAGSGEALFVLAFADEQGAAALAQRIQRQFIPPTSAESEFEASVSCRLLQSIPIEVGATGQSIEEVAALVERYVKTETVERRA
jgi:signal transduction histidine kinase